MRSSTPATPRSSAASTSCSARGWSRRMRLADAARRAFAAAVLIAAAATAAEPRYGQVETFEPGKKYKCVPTPDRKGWDCRELDKGEADDGSGARAAAS